MLEKSQENRMSWEEIFQHPKISLHKISEKMKKRYEISSEAMEEEETEFEE